MENTRKISFNRLRLFRSIFRQVAAVMLLPFYLFPLITFLFSSKRNDIIEDVRVNSNLNTNNVIINFLYLFVYNRYFRVLFYHRIGVFTGTLLNFFYSKEKTFIISHTTFIGRGLKLSHPFATIINADKIGVECQIRQCTTIGNKNNDNQRPVIGNNVVLGANVNIIGSIEVGSNSIIGAGTTVSKNVISGSIVVGGPSRCL